MLFDTALKNPSWRICHREHILNNGMGSKLSTAASFSTRTSRRAYMNRVWEYQSLKISILEFVNPSLLEVWLQIIMTIDRTEPVRTTAKKHSSFCEKQNSLSSWFSILHELTLVSFSWKLYSRLKCCPDAQSAKRGDYQVSAQKSVFGDYTSQNLILPWLHAGHDNSHKNTIRTRYMRQ